MSGKKKNRADANKLTSKQETFAYLVGFEKRTYWINVNKVDTKRADT